MPRQRFLLALALGLLAPGVLPAQAPSGGDLPPGAKTPPLTGAQAKQMYENVEIMRRLLQRGLHRFQMGNCTSCHGTMLGRQPNSLAFSTDGKMLATRKLGDVEIWDVATGKQIASGHGMPTEGVYLKGQGVLFTVTLPPMSPQPSPPKSPATKPLSEWEQIRLQLRGEESKKTASPTQQPDVEEVLFHLLAENGHHFKQLSPKESLTVAVIFRGATSSGLMGGGGPPGMPLGGPHSGFGMPGSGGSGGPLMGSGGTSNGIGKQAKDFELLADLQLKQDKVDEAVQLYLRALQLKPMQEQMTGLNRKLARAFLVMEEQAQKSDARKAAMEKALHYLAQIQEKFKDDKIKTVPVSRGTPLPSRLQVSASKQLLDEVAAGKISLEDFRNAATVEWLHLPAVEGKSQPGKTR